MSEQSKRLAELPGILRDDHTDLHFSDSEPDCREQAELLQDDTCLEAAEAIEYLLALVATLSAPLTEDEKAVFRKVNQNECENLGSLIIRAIAPGFNAVIAHRMEAES